MAGPSRVRAEDQVAEEAPLELRLDGRPLVVLMRTPGDDEELARGFLYSEGLITRPGDIVSLGRPERLVGDEVGNVLDIALSPHVERPRVERLFYASSSCGVCGKNKISSLAIAAPVIDSALRVTTSVLAALPGRLRSLQPSFSATGGLHAAGLFTPDGEPLCVREDVGRHNALDKVMGWALVQGALPLKGRVLVLSGRVSYELVQKAITAGAPIMAAVGAPSSLAVELAEEFGVTLAGFVHDGGMNLYAHAHRVAP